MRAQPQHVQEFERFLRDERISYVEARKQRGPRVRNTDLAGAPGYLLFPRQGARQIAAILRGPAARLTLTDGQQEWFRRLEERGWRCCVWYGADEAIESLRELGAAGGAT